MENIQKSTQEFQQAGYKYLGVVMEEIHNGSDEVKGKVKCEKVLKGFAMILEGIALIIEAFKK